MSEPSRIEASDREPSPRDGSVAAIPEAIHTALRYRLAARVIRVLALVFTDAAALLLAATLAYFLWARPIYGQPARMYFDLLPILPLFILGYSLGGLYPGFGLGAVRTFRQLTLRTSFLFVVLAATSFALKVPHLYSRMTFVLAWVLSLTMVPVCRFLLLAAAKKWSWWKEPVVVVGVREPPQRIVVSLCQSLSLGYRPVGIVTASPAQANDDISDLTEIHDLGVLPHLANLGIHWAFMSEEVEASSGLLDLLQRHFRHVILVREREGIPSENLQVLHLEGLMGIEVRNNLLQTHNQVAKRAMDLALGTVALVLSIPVILLGAIAVKLADGGPAFYVQTREGYLGKPIRVWKLRTMHSDSKKRLRAHLEANPSAKREWNDRFKLEGDPRILPVVGPILRRFSLDELPQLWTVIKGDMSLVGPRPFPNYHLEVFPKDFRALRQRVRPGLTGLWQVMARTRGSVKEQQFYDTSYIRSWSLWLDVYVLARTALTVLFPKNASQLVTLGE